MKKTLTTLSVRALSAVVLLGACMTSVAAQELTLRFHHFLPQQANVPTHILQVWADRVEADSNGRIEIQMFPAMQLGGSAPELIDQAADGVADIVWTLPGYTPGRFPRAEVFELPFMMDDPVSASQAYWTLLEEEMAGTEFQDVHVIGAWVHGPGVIHSATAVSDLSDLVGLKVRAPTRVTNALFSELGATPVGMPVPAVPEALSKGVVDATVLPWETTAALRVSELVGTHTEFEGRALYTAAFIVAMNKDRYAAMPDDLKAVLDAHSGMAFASFASETHWSYDGPVRQAAIDKGNQVITISEDQNAAWHDAAQTVVDNWLVEMADRGIDGEALLDRARTLIDQNAENR